MELSYLEEVVVMCDEALVVLRRSDELRAAIKPTPIEAVSAIGKALTDGKSVRGDLIALAPPRLQAPLQSAVIRSCISSFRHGTAYADHSGVVLEVKRLLLETISYHRGKIPAIPHIVFYSWHSDRPNSSNRGFIEDALGKAIKRVAADGEVLARIDQGAQGAAGSQSLHGTILKKIRESGMFVADVSLISDSDSGKRHCNSNVMYELGYATHCLSEDRVVLICNTAYGRIEDLPFDIKHKEVLAYSLKEGEDKAQQRDSLVKRLEGKLRLGFKIEA